MLASFYLSAFMWGKSVLVSLSRGCGVMGQLLTSPDSLIPSRIAALSTAYRSQSPANSEISSIAIQKSVKRVISNSIGFIGVPQFSGMTLLVCGPSDINGAGPVVTAPPVPGPGVRIFEPNYKAWDAISGFLTDQKRERANRLKRAARARRQRGEL